MSGIRFQSEVVEDEEVGDFPILGKGVGPLQRLNVLQCPTLPDLLINCCEVTFLIMFLLMLKTIIPVNILYIIVPFALSMLGDILMVTETCYFFYRPLPGSLYFNNWNFVNGWVTFFIVMIQLLRIYLVCKYIYAFSVVLNATNSLAIFTRPNIYLEMEVKLPSYLQPIDATFIFLLLIFGNCASLLSTRSSDNLQRSYTDAMIRWSSGIDSFAWYLYMFICRCMQRSNEFAHFSMLIRNLPILYFSLAVIRAWFCCFYKTSQTFGCGISEAPWKMNCRGIRLLLDTAVFIGAIVFICFYFTRSTIDCFYYFIYLAVTERVVLSLLNVHLLWYYDAEDDPVCGLSDIGMRAPNIPPPMLEPRRGGFPPLRAYDPPPAEQKDVRIDLSPRGALPRKPAGQERNHPIPVGYNASRRLSFDINSDYNPALFGEDVVPSGKRLPDPLPQPVPEPRPLAERLLQPVPQPVPQPSVDDHLQRKPVPFPQPYAAVPAKLPAVAPPAAIPQPVPAPPEVDDWRKFPPPPKYTPFDNRAAPALPVQEIPLKEESRFEGYSDFHVEPMARPPSPPPGYGVESGGVDNDPSPPHYHDALRAKEKEG